MGALRFLLALMVVIGHSQWSMFGLKFLHASAAVQLFYVVSGFYMGLILSSKYPRGTYFLFISNRFLRIFPTYFAVALISLGYLIYSKSFGSGWTLIHWYAVKDVLSPFSWIYLVTTNIVIFGQDIVMFLGLDSGHLYLTANYESSVEPHVHKLLLIPQAWSLSVELLFYLVAPIIIWSGRWTIAAVLLFSLTLKIYLFYFKGYTFDPWNYRFFPTELFCFLLGSASYLVGRRIQFKNSIRFLYLAIPLLYIVFLLSAPFFADTYEMNPRWALIVCTALALPFLFRLTSRSSFDRLIGELSYPIYLVHILTIWILIDFRIAKTHSVWLSIVASIGLYYAILRPIDKLRERRLQFRSKANGTPVAAP